MAKKLGCSITRIPSLSVAVVDDARVTINLVVNQFSCSLHNTEFSSYMLLIPLGCCDVVLGIEWLVTLGDITWKFDRLSMQFYVHGKTLVLRGATSEGLKTARKKNNYRKQLLPVCIYPCFTWVSRLIPSYCSH